MSGLSRRLFMKVMAAAGGGLTVGFLVEGCGHAKGVQVLGGGFHPNAWVSIGADDSVAFALTQAEMGQGVLTSHTQMLAEELEVPLERIQVQFAPVDFGAYGVQLTGGSMSTTSQWDVIRTAGATTRELLKKAAARKWGVPVEEVTAKAGALHHAKLGVLRYGDVAALAADESVGSVPLKERSSWGVIGKSVRRLDGPAKVDGSAVFGIDVQLPGLLTAVVLRSPVLRGRLVSFDANKALASPGVKHVVQIPQGVAVVADGTWHAKKGAALVDVKWDDGSMAGFSTESLRWRHISMLKRDAKIVTAKGRVDRALDGAKKRVRAVYEVPYLAHVPMEPMNATAWVQGDRCRVWAPTQSPTVVRGIAARVAGVPDANVEVVTTFLGGGFGRRAAADFISEAVAISKAVGAPVKVQWSREDDVRFATYRPASLALVDGAVGEDGMPVAWFHRIAGQSLVPGAADLIGAFAPEMLPQVALDIIESGVADLFVDGKVVDPTAVEGAADKPYAVPNEQVEIAVYEPGVPVFSWRSVGHSINGFVVEGFVDELAHLGAHDPYAFRRALLKDAPRNRAVLEAAAKGIDWEKGPAPGRFYGIAQHACFGSVCAHALEISIDGDGSAANPGGRALRVHRVVTAIDCGVAVNPDLVAAQMESGVIFGLSAALSQRIDFDGGRVRQSNFHDFPLLRMPAAPKIETIIIESGDRPTGVGELAVPPLAPALANAFFAATGVRLRRLPLGPDIALVLAGDKPEEVSL